MNCDFDSLMRFLGTNLAALKLNPLRTFLFALLLKGCAYLFTQLVKMMLLATFFPASELPGGLLDIKGEFLKVSYTSNGVAKALGMSNSRNVSPLKCPSIKISGKNLEFMTYLNKHCVCCELTQPC